MSFWSKIFGKKETNDKGIAKSELATTKVEEPAQGPMEDLESHEPTSEANDLQNKTVVQLKKMAREKGVTGYSSMKKAELIDALKK